MGAREVAVEQANYWRDSAQDCTVELAEDVWVVTTTVAQAEALRATLDHLRSALRTYAAETKAEAPAPARRAPRRAQV